MTKQIIQESKDLLIRTSNLIDCEKFYVWERKPFVTEFLSIEATLTYEDVVTGMYANHADPTKLDCALVRKTDGMAIGRINISRYDKFNKNIDITQIYIGEESALKKGYARQALEMLLKYFFEELGLERVTLDYYNGNSACALYRKIGFQDEGRARNITRKNGMFFDLNVMSILREEYFNRTLTI